MSSKSARRRQRERERRREQAALRAFEDIPTDFQHVACADAALAMTRALLDDATDVLTELADQAASSRDAWPVVPEADELRAVFEAVRGVAIEGRAKLQAVRDRATRFHEGERHLHLAGGRVVQMVPIEGASKPDDGPDDDIPF